MELNGVLEKYRIAPYVKYKIRDDEEKQWQVRYGEIVKDSEHQLKSCVFYFRKFESSVNRRMTFCLN